MNFDVSPKGRSLKQHFDCSQRLWIFTSPQIMPLHPYSPWLKSQWGSGCQSNPLCPPCLHTHPTLVWWLHSSPSSYESRTGSWDSLGWREGWWQVQRNCSSSSLDGCTYSPSASPSLHNEQLTIENISNAVVQFGRVLLGWVFGGFLACNRRRYCWGACLVGYHVGWGFKYY